MVLLQLHGGGGGKEERKVREGERRERGDPPFG
jgi:hypothetical protein